MPNSVITLLFLKNCWLLHKDSMPLCPISEKQKFALGIMYAQIALLANLDFSFFKMGITYHNISLCPLYIQNLYILKPLHSKTSISKTSAFQTSTSQNLYIPTFYIPKPLHSKLLHPLYLSALSFTPIRTLPNYLNQKAPTVRSKNLTFGATFHPKMLYNIQSIQNT